MTEAEWLACDDPKRLVDGIHLPSSRKLRLFAVACCRNLVPRMRSGRAAARSLADLAEKFADGHVEQEELREAVGNRQAKDWEEAIARCICGPAALRAVHGVVYCAEKFASVAWVKDHPGQRQESKGARAARAAEAATQVALLRCVFGNPFRRTTVSPDWLVWSDSTLPRLAEAIYDDRAFGHLPVLADALEDAGCTDPDILSHLRSPGVHVRGCWALDLVLGKS
jgi:hypothetical protein